MKIRYALTKVDKDGLRVLALANQGRHHFDTQKEGEMFLENILRNNSKNTLRQVFGDTRKLRVDPVECYDHGDAIKTVLGED